jgi:hypothetical protein
MQKHGLVCAEIHCIFETNMCTVTGGSDCGVMKRVGEAIRGQGQVCSSIDVSSLSLFSFNLLCLTKY